MARNREGISHVVPHALLLTLALGCVATPLTVQAAPCGDPPVAAGVRAICGITAPEDLVPVGDYLIVSSLVPAATLFMVDTRDDSTRPMVTRLREPDDDMRWGDPACRPPASLVSHGLDLSRGTDGRWRLLVVSHGERESIEFFEVLQSAEGDPALQWRGCTVTPEKAVFNDVAALPDGGYLATDPAGASWQRTRALLGMLGVGVGRVYRWTPGAGHTTVPNTAAPYPNGIVLDAAGDSFFVNVYFAGEIRQHDLESGEILARAAVQKPDNSNWSPDGTLLVASHRASVLSAMEAVGSEPATRNDIPWAIVEVDPTNMSTRELYVDDGSALGGGTAAVRAGDALYIGAFRGDRLLRVEINR